jgi:Holliday junction DNA helicase RuvA
MIAHLRGRLLEKQPQRVIVDVQGVGYEVHVPLSTFYELGEPGVDVALRIHTHVREEALALYGFLTSRELEIFERLIAIGGIGPKLALAVLSGIEPQEFVRAVRVNDIARLTSIPGIGKKTAERIGSPRSSTPRRKTSCEPTCSRRWSIWDIIGRLPRKRWPARRGPKADRSRKC